jgi:hypothetical protein
MSWADLSDCDDVLVQSAPAKIDSTSIVPAGTVSPVKGRSIQSPSSKKMGPRGAERISPGRDQTDLGMMPLDGAGPAATATNVVDDGVSNSTVEGSGSLLMSCNIPNYLDVVAAAVMETPPCTPYVGDGSRSVVAPVMANTPRTPCVDAGS